MADAATEFQIEIREILSRVETIQADTLGEAIDKAMELYAKQQVVLDYSDFKGVDYIPIRIARYDRQRNLVAKKHRSYRAASLDHEIYTGGLMDEQISRQRYDEGS